MNISLSSLLQGKKTTYLQMAQNFLFTSKPLIPIAMTPLPLAYIITLARPHMVLRQMRREQITRLELLPAPAPAADVRQRAVVLRRRGGRRRRGRHHARVL